MNKLIGVVTTLAVSAAVTVSGAGPTQAHEVGRPDKGETTSSAVDKLVINKPVVTRAEYRRIEKNMKISRVHKIFGTSGEQTLFLPGDPAVDEPARQYRDYRTGSKYGFVSVTYVQNGGTWLVTRKAAYWG